MSGEVPERYPCPCCGYRVHDSPCSHEICPVCYWEDDPVRLRWPQYRGGANRESLLEAQCNFQNIGAAAARTSRLTRSPADGEILDPGFRPADPEVDDFEALDDQASAWPSNRTALYWWRPAYWRK